MTRILFFSMEDRWAPARMCRPLAASGFRIAALCPAGAMIVAAGDAERHFELPVTRNWRPMIRRLIAALAEWSPHLVVPTDEQVIVLVHRLLDADRRRPVPGLNDAMRRTLAFSLGAGSRHDDKQFKNRTHALAQSIGVRVPDGGEASSLDKAEAIAARIGYPLVVKQSFGCAGTAVRICRDGDELAAAVRDLSTAPPSRLKRRVRQALGRDWFPEQPPLIIQRCIRGEPAMYTFAALDGVMLAGFASLKRRTSGETGPSSVVVCGPDAAMADSAGRMVSALGLTGFAAFDFMVEHATALPYLIECNARPNPVHHLGDRIGVDLCAAMRNALDCGRAPTAAAVCAQRSETIALFPQEWLRDPMSGEFRDIHHDVPWDEPRLLTAIVASVADKTAGIETRPAAANSSNSIDPAHRPLQMFDLKS